jgi:hypothetical protein
LEALNDTITEAEDAITNATDDADAPGLGLSLVTIDASTVTGTSGDDIFLLSDTDSAVLNFNTQGSDKLYVGTGFTLVTAGEDDAITDSLGDVAVLEAIVIDDGTDTKIYFEEETFAGNSSSTSDLVEITLDGVTGAEVSIDANGFLTIA